MMVFTTPTEKTLREWKIEIIVKIEITSRDLGTLGEMMIEWIKEMEIIEEIREGGMKGMNKMIATAGVTRIEARVRMIGDQTTSGTGTLKGHEMKAEVVGTMTDKMVTTGIVATMTEIAETMRGHNKRKNEAGEMIENAKLKRETVALIREARMMIGHKGMIEKSAEMKIKGYKTKKETAKMTGNKGMRPKIAGTMVKRETAEEKKENHEIGEMTIEVEEIMIRGDEMMTG